MSLLPLSPRTTIYFCIIQYPSVVYTPSSVDTHLDRLPPVRGKLVLITSLKNQPESSQDVLLLYQCQHLLLFQFLELKQVRIHQHSPLMMLLLTLRVFMIIFLLPFIRVNTLSHLILSLALYFIHTLSPLFHDFISSLDSYSILKFVSEALSIPGWKDVITEEMLTLKQNETWDLVVLLPGKK